MLNICGAEYVHKLDWNCISTHTIENNKKRTNKNFITVYISLQKEECMTELLFLKNTK